MTRQLARRRRRERLAGLALALVGVAVLTVAVIALRNPSATVTGASAPRSTGLTVASTSRSQARTQPSSTPLATPSAQATQTTPAGRVGPADVARLPLVVLNNTVVQGLAEQASARFAAGGWTVSSYGNYQNDIISTCAYFDPSVAGAQASADALRTQFPAIKRVVPKFAQLPAGPIVVVLAPDYSAN